MKKKTQRKIKPKRNTIVIDTEHPDARHIRVTYKGRSVLCQAVELTLMDGKYMLAEPRDNDLGFELVEDGIPENADIEIICGQPFPVPKTRTTRHIT